MELKRLSSRDEDGIGVNAGDSKLMLLGINLRLLEKVNAARHNLLLLVVFANMKRQGKDFSSRVTPLFSTMMVQAQQEQGEVPSDNLANEAVNEENVSKHSNDPLLSGEDRLKLEAPSTLPPRGLDVSRVVSSEAEGFLRDFEQCLQDPRDMAEGKLRTADPQSTRLGVKVESARLHRQKGCYVKSQVKQQSQKQTTFFKEARVTSRRNKKTFEIEEMFLNCFKTLGRKKRTASLQLDGG
ncbi:hypothetical protein Tco_0916121 [Tanacetum coccineum]